MSAVTAISLPAVAIVAARRSPIGRFQGSLKHLSAPQLGALVLDRCLKDVEDKGGSAFSRQSGISEVIVGQVLQAGCGQNPARQTAMEAGVGQETPSFTINKVCGSGLKVIELAAQAIQLAALSGSEKIIVAGGQEVMSRAPFLMGGSEGRGGVKMGDWKLKDSMVLYLLEVIEFRTV